MTRTSPHSSVAATDTQASVCRVQEERGQALPLPLAQRQLDELLQQAKVPSILWS